MKAVELIGRCLLSATDVHLLFAARLHPEVPQVKGKCAFSQLPWLKRRWWCMNQESKKKQAPDRDIDSKQKPDFFSSSDCLYKIIRHMSYCLNSSRPIPTKCLRSRGSDFLSSRHWLVLYILFMCFLLLVCWTRPDCCVIENQRVETRTQNNRAPWQFPPFRIAPWDKSSVPNVPKALSITLHCLVGIELWRDILHLGFWLFRGVTLVVNGKLGRVWELTKITG